MDAIPADYFVTSLQFTPHTHRAVYPSIDPENPANSLSGKVVIITGASRGIGAKGLVPAFVRAGVKAIVLVATALDKLKTVEEEACRLRQSVQTLVVSADVSDAKAVDDLFLKIGETFGHADILVNNGGTLSGGGSLHEEDLTKWWWNFEVNTRGLFLLAQRFIRALPSPSTKATILNMTSASSWINVAAVAKKSGYATSKLAALQLTRYIAQDYPNIAAISLHPDLVDTDMLDPDYKIFNLSPPDLAAAVAVWLATDKARFLSGKTICANWDVDELIAGKDEVVKGDMLQLQLAGKFGKEQFEL